MLRQNSSAGENAPRLAEFRYSLRGTFGGRPVIGMHFAEHLPIATLDISLIGGDACSEQRGFVGPSEAELIKCPRRRILECHPTEHSSRSDSTQHGDEIYTDGTDPIDCGPDRSHDRPPRGCVEVGCCIDRAEHLLFGHAAGVEIERQSLALTEKAMPNRVESNRVDLESVPQDRLGYRSTILEIAHEALQIRNDFGIDRRNEIGNNASEEDAPEARRWIARKRGGSERHASGGRMGSGTEDFEFGQDHHGNDSTADGPDPERRRLGFRWSSKA